MIKSRFQGHILHIITSFSYQYFRGFFGAEKKFNTHMGVLGLIFSKKIRIGVLILIVRRYFANF